MVSLQDIAARKNPAGLKCPRCSSHWVGVTDNRLIDEGRVRRRRRLCAECHFRWSTFERPHGYRSTPQNDAALLDRWLNVHDVRGMGVRAVEMSK